MFLDYNVFDVAITYAKSSLWKETTTRDELNACYASTTPPVSYAKKLIALFYVVAFLPGL